MACKAIGIDLGTTYSCVAVYKNGRVEIISNNYGNRMTASCVGFTEHGTLVGDAAKEQLASNPSNTVYAVKRLIGRRFSEQCVQDDMKNWPFTVVAGEGDKPMIEVKPSDGEPRRYTPEDVSSMVLNHLKKTAENYLGHLVTDAVITVPANYGDAQRQATCDAARLAGLNVLRVINEPTAAALAYGLENLALLGERNILVFDMGGGTLDVSILAVSKDIQFEVKASAGNSHLGGDDLDNRMVAHFADEFQRNNKVNVSADKRAVRRLAAKCERTKRVLSENPSSAVEIDCLFQGQDCYSKITRAQFETMCGNLFNKTLVPVEEALKYAKLEKGAIDEIVLAGGSSRIPKIQELLKEYFVGKRLNKSINPDEAVACGAAVLAAKMSGEKAVGIDRMGFVDITNSSFSIEDWKGNSVVAIPRGSNIPVKISQIKTTALDYQTVATFLVYEGEKSKAKDNYYLGQFTVDNIPVKLKREVKFDTTMEIDDNGILHVSAVETSTGKANQISFTRRVV